MAALKHCAPKNKCGVEFFPQSGKACTDNIASVGRCAGITLQLAAPNAALIETMPWLAFLLLATKKVATKKSAFRWFFHLGGPGLILLGLLDNSIIPVPGSVDVLTIYLAARHREPWIYYTLMATIGSLIGGYLTYRMARKGGKEMLEKRFSERRVKKLYALFESWGFAAVAIPAILPPPFPIVAMLLGAGAMQYPTKKFLAALAVGRGVRYAILGYLGWHYGRHIVKFFDQYYWPVLIALVAFSAAAGLYGWFEYRRRQKGANPKPARPRAQIRRRTA